ncbi:MAG: polymer-forming cytoskeletal protein [Pelagibacterales bacterium]|nr:polymer-forming cytoskeletal protein [Pelagibacterales bacterium]
MPSVFLKDVTIKGTLTLNDSMTFDGQLVGDILESDEVIIKSSGNITGNVNAKEKVEISGKVIGDVASSNIHLNSDAYVQGKLFHKNLSIDSGAKLEITASTRKEVTNIRGK